MSLIVKSGMTVRSAEEMADISVITSYSHRFAAGGVLKMKKAVVGMSGGVDSSVAAYLMREAGYDTAGATMILTERRSTDNDSCADTVLPNAYASGCDAAALPYADANVKDARSVADRLGIPHYVFDMRDDFRCTVIDNFVNAYENGATPNPCVVCNRRLKFGRLYDLAAEQLACDRIACAHEFSRCSDAAGCNNNSRYNNNSNGKPDNLYIVTGHYAVIERSPGGRMLLRKGTDPGKDQSYFLYPLTQDQLSHALFPLGSMTKTEVKEIAQQQGFVSARRKESQDICFIPGGDYASFLKEYTGHDYPAGDFVDADGNVMGRHKGIVNYTIGQRKGLGLALKKPAYVLDIDKAGNKVILGDNSDLFLRELTARDFNWVSMDVPAGEFRASARIRYRHREAPACIIPLSADTVRIVFDEPQRAITRGQSVVLYDGEYVLGGGIIE